MKREHYITKHPDGYIVRISFPDSVKTKFFSRIKKAREFDVVDQIKKLLDVDGIVIITSKETPTGVHMEAGTGIKSSFVLPTVHAMAEISSSMLGRFLGPTEFTKKVEATPLKP